MPKPIATIGEFYAHALAIEREAAERYEEFAEHFSARGDDVLEGLCRSLAGFEQAHYAELAAASSRLSLPAIAPGDYRWLEDASPEAAARDALYRIANPRQLLEIALQAECRARDFFLEIAATASSLQVRKLAGEMAVEEMEHVSWVRQALEYRTAGDADWESLLKKGVGPGIVSPA